MTRRPPGRTAEDEEQPELPKDDDELAVGDEVKTTAGAGRRKQVTPTSRKSLGLEPRKLGRPAGPTRVMMNVRVLLETDALVTEIGGALGMGPQDVTDAAIAYYAAHLRRTGKLPKVSEKSPQEPKEQSEAS